MEDVRELTVKKKPPPESFELFRVRNISSVMLSQKAE